MARPTPRSPRSGKKRPRSENAECIGPSRLQIGCPKVRTMGLCSPTQVPVWNQFTLRKGAQAHGRRCATPPAPEGTDCIAQADSHTPGFVPQPAQLSLEIGADCGKIEVAATYGVRIWSS